MVTVKKRWGMYYEIPGSNKLTKLNKDTEFDPGAEVYLYKLNNGNSQRININRNLLNSKKNVYIPQFEGTYKIVWPRTIIEWMDVYALSVLLVLCVFLCIWLVVLLIDPTAKPPLLFGLTLIVIAALSIGALTVPFRIIGGWYVVFTHKEAKTPYFKLVDLCPLEIDYSNYKMAISDIFTAAGFDSKTHIKEFEQLTIGYKFVEKNNRIKSINLQIKIKSDYSYGYDQTIDWKICNINLHSNKLTTNDLTSLKNEIHRFLEDELEFFTTIEKLSKLYKQRKIKLNSKFYAAWMLNSTN